MNHPPQHMLPMHTRPGVFPPSPPHSLNHSNNGPGPWSTSSGGESRKYPTPRMEDHLQEHYRVLKEYLAASIAEEEEGYQPHHRARDKLLRLSPIQFQELSTDVYDELLRREHDRRNPPSATDVNYPQFLLPKPNFHPKRNQARQKLSTLAVNKFRELAGDVLFELERRHPHFASLSLQRVASPPGQNTNGMKNVARSSSRSSPGFPPSGNSNRARSSSRGPGFPPGPHTNRARSSSRGPKAPPGGPPNRARSSSRGPAYPPLGPSSSPSFSPAGLPTLVQGLRRPSNPIPSTSGYSPTIENGHRNGSGTFPNNDYGRPLPQPFQNSPISTARTRSEQFDDHHDDNMSESDYGAEPGGARGSRRATNKSLPYSMQEHPLTADFQAQISQLEQKILNLETQLRQKDEDLIKSQTNETEHKKALESERTNTNSLNSRLTTATAEATQFQSTISTLQSTNARLEASLLAATTSTSSSNEWKHRYESLQSDLHNQQRITEQVRHEAAQNLAEMRAVADASAAAADQEEARVRRIRELEVAVEDWKGRYTKAKAQLRNLRAMSTAFNITAASGGLSGVGRDGSGSGAAVLDPKGMVKDVSVTQYQIAVDELLQLSRGANPGAVMDFMRTIVGAVRGITEDVDAALAAASSSSSSSSTHPPPLNATSSNTNTTNGTTITTTTNGPPTPTTPTNPHPQTHTQQHQHQHSPPTPRAQKIHKLKSQISTTANNLITAARNFSQAKGMSPVSLLDAAAGNLTRAVVELVVEVGVRQTEGLVVGGVGVGGAGGAEGERGYGGRGGGGLAGMGRGLGGLDGVDEEGVEAWGEIFGGKAGVGGFGVGTGGFGKGTGVNVGMGVGANTDWKDFR